MEDKDMQMNNDDDEHSNEESDIDEAEDVEGVSEQAGFTVLGDYKPKVKKKVTRILPAWLRNPVLIPHNKEEDFESIRDISPELVTKLKENELHKSFPVQSTVIPDILSQCQYGVYAGDKGFRPRDLCISAPTGSGKTLTFVLPIVQMLKDRVVPHVRALVVLPVRDLAIQVYNVFKTYCSITQSKNFPLKVGLIAGKKDFASEQKILLKERLFSTKNEKWKSAVDIVVATKGRLLDHIEMTEGFDLTHLRWLVIDEADRQMEDMFDDWLGQVEKAAYTPKAGAYSPYQRNMMGSITVNRMLEPVMHMQKLLFSATLSQNPEKLEQVNLFLPKLYASVLPSMEIEENLQTENATKSAPMDAPISTDKYSTPDSLKEMYMVCKPAEKPLIVLHFLLSKGFKQVLCFTNSVESAHRLNLVAKQFAGLRVAELSSNIHTEKRERIIRQFTKGQIQLLICSDVMTRGMDIENVQYVISYDHPKYIETYIHRVGRTARANKQGTALTLLESKDLSYFKKMFIKSGRWDKLKKINVNRKELEPLVPQFSQALKCLPTILKEQKRQKKKS